MRADGAPDAAEAAGLPLDQARRSGSAPDTAGSKLLSVGKAHLPSIDCTLDLDAIDADPLGE